MLSKCILSCIVCINLVLAISFLDDHVESIILIPTFRRHDTTSTIFSVLRYRRLELVLLSDLVFKRDLVPLVGEIAGCILLAIVLG